MRSAPPSVPVAPPIKGSGVRVLSWNLLRRIGATCEDVARLIEAQHVDVALLQEATVDMEALPSLIGGAFVRHALPGRIHGPAIWARHGMARPRRVPLESRTIRRHALVAEIGGTAFACVHLSHGQLMCRRQAREASEALATATAVVAGDFNMVGPLKLPGFREVGPREPTHYANGLVPVRIDRCFVRGLVGRHARALDRGRSDHRPIVLDLFAQPHEAAQKFRAAA
ncbi:MAG: endonuclease/exonuclease/phosphatase family protein [Alphaproteobacteria bacterium]|nr:endonuclease/exonuclease/phosphatase family protein [Alphaproteobacteria bacterium]